MSQPPTTGATRAETPPGPRSASTGEPIRHLGDRIGTPLRDEVRSARAEVTRRAERLGVGAGLSGGTGPLALSGLEQGISR